MSEAQKEFSIPSPKSGQRSMPNEDGIRMLVMNSYELFPDRPRIVQDHWNAGHKFCRCDDCLKYFGEGVYDRD